MEPIQFATKEEEDVVLSLLYTTEKALEEGIQEMEQLFAMGQVVAKMAAEQATAPGLAKMQARAKEIIDFEPQMQEDIQKRKYQLKLLQEFLNRIAPNRGAVEEDQEKSGEVQA